MRTAIVTDSTAYLTIEERQQYNIHMIPLSVVIDKESFEEEVTITASEFYDKVRNEEKLPKTTQPPLGKFVTLFEELAKDYDEVISIHLSSGISGTFDGALQAADMVEGIKVYGFDSEVAAAVQGFYAIRAAQLVAEGKTAAEILPELEEMRKSGVAYIIVEDLAHLQRGGRLSAAAALLGGLLQIKPILHFDNKIIQPLEKIRTRKKAMKRVEELLELAVSEHGDLEIAVIHANCEEETQLWLNDLSGRYPNCDFKLSYFGPVIGTHLGEGSVAIGWFKKKA